MAFRLFRHARRRLRLLACRRFRHGMMPASMMAMASQKCGKRRAYFAPSLKTLPRHREHDMIFSPDDDLRCNAVHCYFEASITPAPYAAIGLYR